jgi:hypothetical protein
LAFEARIGLCEIPDVNNQAHDARATVAPVHDFSVECSRFLHPHISSARAFPKSECALGKRSRSRTGYRRPCRCCGHRRRPRASARS